MATEADNELLSCSEPAKEAISEHSSCAEAATVSGFELSVLPVSSNMSEHSVYPVLVKKSVVESFACPAPTYESECELSTCLMSLTEMSTSPVSVNAPGFDLSARPLPPSVFNPELSVYTKVCTVPVRVTLNCLSNHSQGSQYRVCCHVCQNPETHLGTLKPACHEPRDYSCIPCLSC